MKKNNYLRWDVLMRYTHKVLFLLRLTTVMILAAGFQLSAANGSFVKPRMGYNVVGYEDRLVSNISLEAKFEPTSLNEVLKNLLHCSSVNYEVIDSNIIIKEGSSTPLEEISKFFSSIEVRGRVVDENNQPLLGATVKIKGSSKSTVTNANGEFSLANVNENAILVISFIGYDTKEINASENLGNIQLTQNTDNLKEVEVNAGYYTVKDRERTGSISRVDAKTIAQQPVNNPLQALQNRVPGVEITQLTGVPGGGFTVRIRGRNSINSGNEPLYIIDGVIFPSSKFSSGNSLLQGNGSPLSILNASDIESIDVLKDADATAIYGSRGANGVILITTKKGSIGELKINANIFQGFSQVAHRLDLMNTEQYLAMRMEAFKNDGLSPTAIDYDVNGVWDKNKYTDWQEEMIGDNANTTNAALNVSGGAKNSNYLVSGTYYNEGTVFPGSFGFKRGGIHTNINFGSSESQFNASFSGTYSHLITNLPSFEPTSDIMRTPNAPDPYDEYGKFRWYYNNLPVGTNPMASLLRTTDANADNLVGNANLGYRIIKGLILKVSFGYNTLKREEFKKSPLIARNPATNPTSVNRQSEFGNISNSSWIVEPQLTYEYKLGPGQINALIGMSFQENVSEYRNIVASNFNSDELMANISSATTFSVNDVSYSKYKYAALFARVNYGLLNKYYLNLTARRDGSSRFGPGKQFANFGAVGASWIFSEEVFFKNKLPFLNFGKLRASYGITGNDQIQDYQYMDLYSGTSSYQGTSAIYPGLPANPYFAWETNKKAEAALQLSFLKDLINLQISYFRNRSSNQLLNNPLPPSVGGTGNIANLPATVQNTGWEFESTIRFINRRNFGWSTNFNFSIPKNKLVSYPGLANSNNASVYTIGQSLNIRKYYNTTIDSQTGLYVSEDKNQNGVRDNGDIYLSKFVGQTFYGGLQNSVRYHQFSLDFLFSFVKQTGSSYFSSIAIVPGFFQTTLPYNQPVIVTDRWKTPGDVSRFSKFSTTSASITNFGIGKAGVQAIEDASFVRLKNISLSYNLPKHWVSRIKIKDLQLNIQGQNIFTLTHYKGLDPENPSGTAPKLPPLRTWSMGLRITI
jgi:TonB-linked SusC/RagA family outer membrane protein